MTSTAATRNSHDQQPGRSDMNERQREEYLRTAYRAADQEWRAVNEAAHRPSPEDLDAACQRARDAALTALAGAGLGREEALALAERAARQQDDEGEVPVCDADQKAGRYPDKVGSISRHLLADGYTITWAPAPAGCRLTLGRPGPGRRAAYHGAGPTMQDAWDEVRAQLGHGEPQPAAASGTREAPWPAHGGARLYRVVQYYDSWPFHSDSRVRRGGKAGRRTDTFRTLAPVRQRLARANGYAQYQRQHGGDWSAFVAIAEQLTDDGWQPIEVDLLQE
jgi:hypothetical protein